MSHSDFRIEFGGDHLLPAFCAGFNTGFSDYKYGIQMDEAQMVQFLAHSGIDLEHSAVLLQQNGAGWHGAGVALVAVMDGEAWCSGLAVAPALRGAGFGRRLMEAVQANATAAGAHTLRLEVLVNNAPARQLYTALGYQPQRELIFWRTEAPAAPRADVAELHAANVAAALAGAYAWQAVSPAWQRRQRTVALQRDALWAYSFQDGGEIAGWIISQPTASHSPGGHLRQRIVALAVRPGDQRPLLAHRLLASLRAHQPNTVFSVINEPVESIFTPALRDNGFVEMDRQIEMVLPLYDAERVTKGRSSNSPDV